MKHFRLPRLLPWLLIAICPPLLGRCGGAVEQGTETGNPPVVEQRKLHVVLHDDGVEVIGDPGAVTPGASVVVANARTGDRTEVTAAADGSVSASVPGTLADEYEVTVSSGGMTQTVRVSASSSSGAAGAGGAGGELASASCDSLEQTLRAGVAAEYASASTACQVDGDCTIGPDVGCHYTCSGGPAVSVAGAQAARQPILESTAPVCAELISRCGPRGPLPCEPELRTIGCVSGQCAELGCNELRNRLGQRVSDIVDQATHDCAADADCTLVESGASCLTACGPVYSAVASRVATDVNQRLQGAESEGCGELQLHQCPPIPLPCAPTGAPVTAQATCESGQCVVSYTPLP